MLGGRSNPSIVVIAVLGSLEIFAIVAAICVPSMKAIFVDAERILSNLMNTCQFLFCFLPVTYS